MAPWWRIMARRDSGDYGLPFRLSRTCECERGAHHDCGHVLGFVGAAEGKVTLCSCPCHESCPQQGSPGLMDLMLSCTCPGTVQIRRNQEQAGIDPAQVVRLMEARRQRQADPDEVKRELVEVYEAAAAQLAGQTSPHHVTFEGPPQETMEFIVFYLATRYSGTEAARLVGLTETQVSAAVAAARKMKHDRMAALVKHEWTRRRGPRWRSRR
jgi:hypothetical protein